VAVDIVELERRARRLLTPEVYDYYAGGPGSERTLRASVSAWRQHWLMPLPRRTGGRRDLRRHWLARLGGVPVLVKGVCYGPKRRVPAWPG
jgi:hypothetical protein